MKNNRFILIIFTYTFNCFQEDLNIIPVKHLEEVLDIVIPGGLEFLQNPIIDIMPRSKI